MDPAAHACDQARGNYGAEQQQVCFHARILPHNQDMKVALYARVSTSDQKCEMQLRELKEYCKRRGWRIAGQYVDEGWSGAKASRPQLDALMRDAAEHRFDAVLCWKLDRFGRSVLNLSEALQTLNSQGIRFLATSQGIDTDSANPTSRLLLHILAAVAEFEREMIRERVKAGVAAAVARGKHVGRRSAVFDRTKAERLHRAGTPVRRIAAACGIGVATTHRFLATLK